jgi:hypothetical protein
MNRTISWSFAAAMTLAASVQGRAQSQHASSAPPQAEQERTYPKPDPTATLKGWPSNTRFAALNLISKYGPPDAATDQRLVWNDSGQWNQVILYREGVIDDFPTTHANFIENTIHYAVSQEKTAQLQKFNSALIVDHAAGTLSARSNSEEANTLALNLADEIVRGRRNVGTARELMRDTLSEAMAGKSSPYMDRFWFPADVPQR